MNSAVFLRHAVGLGLAVLAGVAAAQSYPSKPIKLQVPFEPGGTNDLSPD